MTRDELEAVIWRHLTAMVSQNTTQGEFVDSVLMAADQYAVTGDTPADRRQILYDARPGIGGDRRPQGTAS